jgi:hypothetical protein
MWGDGPTSNLKSLKPTALQSIHISVNQTTLIWCGNEYILVHSKYTKMSANDMTKVNTQTRNGFAKLDNKKKSSKSLSISRKKW